MRHFALSLALSFVPLAFAGPLHAQEVTPADLHKLPSSAPALIAHYGPDALQVAELRLPKGKGPFPVIAVVHGGCLSAKMENRAGTAALATALTGMGYATWNIEFRSLDSTGGGWPGTYQDWGAAIDYLRTVAKTQPIRLDEVVTLGHSSGAAGAVWLAERRKLPTTSEVRGANPLAVRAAIAIDGPIDLQPYIGLDEKICGQPIVVPLMQGTPDQQPEHYAQATPSQSLPLGAPQMLVSSQVLPLPFAESYAKKAIAAGDSVTTLAVKNGGHFDIIAPGSPVWVTQVQPALKAFLEKTTR